MLGMVCTAGNWDLGCPLRLCFVTVNSGAFSAHKYGKFDGGRITAQSVVQVNLWRKSQT